MKHLIMTLAMLAATTTSQAQGWAPDQLVLGGISKHYSTADGEALNETNPGIGLMWNNRTVLLAGRAHVSAGIYRNSEHRTSAYAAVHKLPWALAGGQAGITLSLNTGYDIATVALVPAPTICWPLACLMVTPPFKHRAGAALLMFKVEI